MKQAHLNFLRITSNEVSRSAAKLLEYSKGTEYEHLATKNFDHANKLNVAIQREYHNRFPYNCPCSDCVTNRILKPE